MLFGCGTWLVLGCESLTLCHSFIMYTHWVYGKSIKCQINSSSVLCAAWCYFCYVFYAHRTRSMLCIKKYSLINAIAGTKIITLSLVEHIFVWTNSMWTEMLQRHEIGCVRCSYYQQYLFIKFNRQTFMSLLGDNRDIRIVHTYVKLI